MLYWKSLVYKVNRKGDSTVLCGARVSLNTITINTTIRQDPAQADLLWPTCQVDSNSEDSGQANPHLTQ